MNLKSYINPRNTFLLSMMLIGFGLSSSNIFMSWGQFGLVFAFLWDGKFKTKFQQLLQNKRILALMAVFGLFMLGLIHTSNFEYAFKDLRIKLPLLILPLFAYSFFPLTVKETRLLFHAVFGGLLFTMAFGSGIYLGLIKWEVNDMRNYSPFVSNVRLGTLLVFSMISIGYFIFHKQYLFINKYFYVFFAVLCIAFLLLIQSLTGIIALIGTLFIIVLYDIVKNKNKRISGITLVIFLIVGGSLTGLTLKEYRRIHTIEKIDIDKLPKATVHGAVYRHDLNATQTVNGHYVWMNVCNWELKREWNKRSKVDYDGNTSKGWSLSGTLITYLSSKGLKKNAEAVQSLSDKEVKAIEKGVVNFLNLNPLDIRWRINQLLVELDGYKKDGDPNGRSFATRIETWKVSMHAISTEKFFGYGTGDVRDAMKESYISTHSKLIPKNQLNPHQQYLTVAMALGLVGLLFFICLIFYPIIFFKHLHVLFVTALTIAGIAMLDEDTLETQAGCTQFIFIYLLTYFMQKVRLDSKQVLK